MFIHATTLEEAEFKLKTGYKASASSYRHCKSFPILGSGQGSTNSPIIWCFISSVAFFTHKQRAHGIFFHTPDQSMSIRISMVGFVDDSTSITGGDASHSYQQVKEMMIKYAQLWHDILWVTGGEIGINQVWLSSYLF